MFLEVEVFASPPHAWRGSRGCSNMIGAFNEVRGVKASFKAFSEVGDCLSSVERALNTKILESLRNLEQ